VEIVRGEEVNLRWKGFVSTVLRCKHQPTNKTRILSTNVSISNMMVAQLTNYLWSLDNRYKTAWGKVMIGIILSLFHHRFICLKEPKNSQTSRSTKEKYALAGVLKTITVLFMQTSKPNITHNDNKNNTNINTKMRKT